MKKPKLYFIEGTDRTGKDTICKSLSEDGVLWVNRPKQMTETAYDINHIHSEHFHNDMYLMNSVELSACAAMFQNTDTVLISNRSHLSSWVYGDDEKRNRICSSVEQITKYLDEYFDVTYFIIYHENIESITDVEYRGSWNEPTSDIQRVNDTYKTLSVTFSLNKSMTFELQQNYANSYLIAKQIIHYT